MMTRPLVRMTASRLLAIATALAMPLAWAQAPPADPAADPAADGAAAAESARPGATTPPGNAAEPRQLTWADVDIDGSGAISQEESGQLPSLAQVFADADADDDGQLTPDEYKAYVATVGTPAPGAGGSD